MALPKVTFHDRGAPPHLDPVPAPSEPASAPAQLELPKPTDTKPSHDES